MNSYEQIINFINNTKKSFDEKIKEYEITYRRNRDRWNSECLSLYKNFIEVLYNSNLKDRNNLIQMTYDIVFKDNVVNFHNVPGKHENDIIDNFLTHQEKPLTHPDIRKAFEDFRKATRNEPPITMYEELENEPVEIQTAIRDQLSKIKKNEKDSKKENILYSVSKDYLNLFIDEAYYDKEVEPFFDNMYNFCEDGKDEQYYEPNQLHALLVKRDNNQKNSLQKKQYTKTNVSIKEIKEDNKLGFIENLYNFLFYPISLCLEILKTTDYPIQQKLLNNTKNCESLSIRKNIVFFVEKNNSTFWKVTNNFININNKFYLGKIKKNASPEEKSDDLEKTTNAVLDYYHMQKVYKSIESLFNFSAPVPRSNVAKRLKTNLKLIEETLKEKYQGTIYDDIPEIFIKLLKEQENFYKISEKEISEKNARRTLEQEEWLNGFGELISNNKKEHYLKSKFKPKNINKTLINYETILYNIAAKVLDPHIPEDQKNDYFKQLTVFYPEVYKFY